MEGRPEGSDYIIMVTSKYSQEKREGLGTTQCNFSKATAPLCRFACPLSLEVRIVAYMYMYM